MNPFFVNLPFPLECYPSTDGTAPSKSSVKFFNERKMNSDFTWVQDAIERINIDDPTTEEENLSASGIGKDIKLCNQLACALKKSYYLGKLRCPKSSSL